MAERNSFFVYEAIAANTVVYVGATTNPTSRLTDHRAKAWWGQVDNWRITVCSTQQAMEDLERRLIGELHPPHNTNLNGGARRVSQGEVSARLLALLSSGPASTAELRTITGYEQASTVLHTMYLAGKIKPVAWTIDACPGGYMATWAQVDYDLPEAMHPNGRMAWQRDPALLSIERTKTLIDSLYTDVRP